jgi:hypothetical protein
MSDWKYVSNVSDAEFNAALVDLEKAIAKKDTPEEWARFTGQALLFVGKIAISQIGLGPVITLVEDIFGDDAELITKLLKMLGEQNETP